VRSSTAPDRAAPLRSRNSPERAASARGSIDQMLVTWADQAATVPRPPRRVRCASWVSNLFVAGSYSSVEASTVKLHRLIPPQDVGLCSFATYPPAIRILPAFGPEATVIAIWSVRGEWSGGPAIKLFVEGS